MAVTTTQFNLFWEPEVNKVRKVRRKMSEREKEERREKKALEKRLAADKEFERKWAERGVFQGQLFNDNIEKQGMDENKIKRNMKKKLIKLTEQDLYDMINECLAKVLNEGVDIDQDNYYGGGLPDNYNKEDAPEKSEVDWNALGEISNQLTPMVDKLFDMANNSDGNTNWLYTIAYQLEKGDKSLKAFLQKK